jgi:hypothetical protein
VLVLLLLLLLLMLLLLLLFSVLLSFKARSIISATYLRTISWLGSTTSS